MMDNIAMGRVVKKVEELIVEMTFVIEGKREDHIITFWENGMVRGDKRIPKK